MNNETLIAQVCKGLPPEIERDIRAALAPHLDEDLSGRLRAVFPAKETFVYLDDRQVYPAEGGQT